MPDACGTCRPASDPQHISEKHATLAVGSSTSSSAVELLARSSTSQQGTATQKAMKMTMLPGMSAPTMAITSGPTALADITFLDGISPTLSVTGSMHVGYTVDPCGMVSISLMACNGGCIPISECSQDGDLTERLLSRLPTRLRVASDSTTEPELHVRCGADKDCAFRVMGDRNRMASFSLGASDATLDHRFEFAENGARNSLQLGAGRRSEGVSHALTPVVSPEEALRDETELFMEIVPVRNTGTAVDDRDRTCIAKDPTVALDTVDIADSCISCRD